MKKTIIFITVITVITFIKAGGVTAQGISLGIWPPLLEVMIQPGKSITQVYKLSNQGETDLLMTSKIASFAPADEQGSIRLLPWANSGILISFQNANLALGEKFLLPAGQTQEIVLKIAVLKARIGDKEKIRAFKQLAML